MKRITVYYRDFCGKDAFDNIWLRAVSVIMDNPDYLIITDDEGREFYFNKKFVIYFSVEDFK